jgi:hypothetical protein
LGEYCTHLPGANVGNSLAKRTLKDETEFESITTYLHKVVDERARRSQRECRREQHHVTQLDKHLQVISKRPVVLKITHKQ